jgi:glycerol-3-phosphate dehydrogenase
MLHTDVAERSNCLCRGLSVALVEQEDFGAGTSSRSTKLVHGGVRYLEKAVFNFDYGQLKLVFEALHERKRLLDNAPHLTTSLPIMTVRRPTFQSDTHLLGVTPATTATVIHHD